MIADDNATTSQSMAAVTRDEFLVQFMAELQNSPLEFLSITEGQQVPCPASQSTFRTEVFSQMSVNLTSITLQEIQELERGFVKAYNGLAFQMCDSLFRQVVAVELHIAPTPGANNSTVGRRLQEVLLDASNGNNSNYNTSRNREEVVPTLFAATGSCRNCLVTTDGQFNLFDDAFQSRRNLLEKNDDVTNKFVPPARNLQLVNGDGTCVCPMDQRPVIGQGPAAEMFSAVLTLEYNRLAEQGIVPSVTTTPDNIVEGQQVTFNGQQIEFKTIVMADIGLDPDTLSGTAKRILENAFAATYNGNCA
jgi:hypothetical protein